MKLWFEGIAKINTTHTKFSNIDMFIMFEGIAKINTTHTEPPYSPQQK